MTAMAALMLFTQGMQAQTIKVYHESMEQGYVLYADNPELYPVSMTMSLELTNLSFSEHEKKIYVIPPAKQRFKIGELTRGRNGATKFRYNYRTTQGDVTVSNYDTGYVYDLPFQKGKSFKLFQGYNGSFSHRQENALDFSMPEGTEVLAAREGTVVAIVQHNTESCLKEECKKYNNYITVMHPDGTFGHYVHIKYNGAKAKLGDVVKKGDVIAYSGNVGWSSGPHLHFVCFLGRFEKRLALATRFKVDPAGTPEMLTEGSMYARNY